MTLSAELLFPTAYYDGPICGLAVTDQEVVWFSGDPYEGRWTLYRLTAEDRQHELDAKRRFESEVGTHWSYDIAPEDRVQRPRVRQLAYFRTVDPDRLRERAERYEDEKRAIGEITRFTNSLRRR
jgi:hypothetical protein